MKIIISVLYVLLELVSAQAAAGPFPSQISIEDATVNTNSTLVTVRGKYKCGDSSKFAIRDGNLSISIMATQAQGRTVRIGSGYYTAGNAVSICDGTEYIYEVTSNPAQLCKRAGCTNVIWNKNDIALLARIDGYVWANDLSCNDAGQVCMPNCDRSFQFSTTTTYTLSR